MNEQVRKMMRDALASGYKPPDGVVRTLAREREINTAFYAVSETDSGRLMLATLRSMCAPLPAGYDDARVRERNAMAWMVFVIEQRIDHGRRGTPAAE